MDKRKTLGIVTASGLTAVGLMLCTLAYGNGFKTSTRLKASDYTLTLNSGNGISASGNSTKNITTDSGAYEVEFGYTNCSPLNGGHATINAGGKIVNNDHIRSISSLVANFATSGELKFRTSYDGATWGGYTTMKSQEEYGLASNPYYIEFSTDGSHSVNVTQIQFSYSCLENPAAIPTANGDYQYEKVTTEQTDWSGEYILVNEESSTNGRVYQGLYYNAQSSYYEYENLAISNGVISEEPYTTVTLTAMTGGYSLLINDGTNGGKYAYGTDGNNHMNFGTTASACTVIWNTNGYAEIAWIGTSGNHILRFNDGSNGSSATYQFRFYKPTSSYGGNASSATAASAAVKLYKKVALSGYETPVDENGFTAVDANKDNYTTNSIYDSSNGLTVKATYTDGSTKTLSRGAEGYSYAIKNSNGAVIDTAQKFNNEDVYTLVVSYKKYIPVEITLNVGLYTYLTGITPSMTNTTFTTADTLSTSLSSNLTAALTYNVSSLNKTVTYSNFNANNLGVALLDPNGVSYDMTKVFGTAGTWTLKVYSTEDSSVCGTVSLTVSAIAVTDITLSNSALTIYVGNSAQLTATVNPTNATNQGISWSSSDSTVASVSESGLVSAKKVGTATITATSSDGGKTATCAVTVKKQSATQATIEANNSTNTNDPASYASDSFNTNGITLTSVSFTQVYGSDDTSFRLGSKNNGGEIVFHFEETLITGITLNAKTYDSNAQVNISTSANTTGETVTITSDGAYETDAFASDTAKSTSITISNAKKNRFYFVSLTITCGVAEPVYPTAISLENATCDVGYTTQLEPTFTPSDTNQTLLTWASNNTNVATVDNTGLVTGVSAGTATITATGEDENGQPVVGSCTVTVTTVAVTGVSLNKTSSEMSLNSTLTLQASVLPANATNKNVTWTSSNTSVATVSNGTVTALAVGSTTITVTTVDGNKTATCSISVVEQSIDSYTIMIYMCGADLESGYDKDTGKTNPNGAGYASGDLDEILSVNGQPSGVNIVVETGGAKAWKKSTIDATKNQRWEIKNKTMTQKYSQSKVNMGLQSTLQSFLEWGFTNYPAQNYGLIMWNHGGAMSGCCFDENFDEDSIDETEFKNAVSTARNNCGITDKLEWVTYDACLMAVQDIAEYNSYNFNYMLASQESEAGYGYDYDAWLPTLYNNPSISGADLLPVIGQTFMDEERDLFAGWNEPFDQTQSVFDLSKMSAYKTAFESFASSLNSIVGTDDTKISQVYNLIYSAQKYGADGNEYLFGIYDVVGALNKIKNNSNYSSLSSKVSSVVSALNQLVIYEEHGDATTGCGLCLYIPVAGYDVPYEYSDSNYTGVHSNFTNWETVANNIFWYNYDNLEG